MNLRDFEYLLAVHRLGSFSKAAQKCNVSQPTLSGQLKKLEQTLGVELMERTTRQVLFTPIGEEVVALATQLTSIAEQIQTVANRSADPMNGEFHLGFIPTVGPGLLPIIMPALKQHYPQARFFLYEYQTEVLLSHLLSGELDAAVLAKVEGLPSLKKICLYTEPLCLAVPASHMLAKQKMAESLDVLQDQDVLFLEDGHCLSDQVKGVCFGSGARENQDFRATSMETLLHMVASGAGLTLVPSLMARDLRFGVHYLQFQSSPPQREIVLATRTSMVRDLAMQCIAELIQSEVRHHGLKT